MAQSRMIAKNTFGEGLIMDFAPNNTLANVLTNALNATLLTYNGNEMSLLNDMGNGRVETAFLPEGYTPVGTCEFGGIIYIVSYNPNDDKCQIGCFPSPERNITRDEESDLQNPTLSFNQFLETDNGREDGNLTGNLKNLVTKVIIRDTDTNPGDKFIISQTRDFTENDLDAFTGLRAYVSGDTLEEPRGKRIKLSIVSIEESGKITKLNTLTYKILAGNISAEYIISENFSIDSGANKVDIDLYRQFVSQQYNVFSSKVPGKLAILAELETITSFSCGHTVRTRTIDKDTSIQYDVYLDYYWETEDPTVNPNYIILSDCYWEKTVGSTVKFGDLTLGFNLENKRLCKTDLNSLIINLPNPVAKDDHGNVLSSYFYTVPRYNEINKLEYANYYYKGSKFDANGNRKLILYHKGSSDKVEVSVGTNQGEIGEIQINNDLGLSNLVLLFSIIIPRTVKNNLLKIPNKFTYKVTPAMSYGLLDHLSIENTIDFSLIGSKVIEPCGFKYFASNDLITINVDSNVYEEENHKVDRVVLEFFDHVGFAGSYTINNRESYAGESVITIPFNDFSLSNLDKDGNQYYHNFLDPIQTDSTKIVPRIIRGADDTTEYKPQLECGDCGVLYKNALYGVKINYHYVELDPITLEPLLGDDTAEWITTPVWMYTNGLFNAEYYSANDFTILQPAVPVLFTYKLTDKTNVNNIYVDDESRKILTSLGSPTALVLNNLNIQLDTLTTYASYGGYIDVEVQMGTSQESIFNLLSMDKNEDLKINLSLMNPYYNTSDLSKEFEIIEQKELKDNNSDEDEQQEVVIYKTYERTDSDKVYLNNQTENGVSLKMDETYKVNTKLLVNFKNVPFTYTPTNYRSEYKEVTVLTPILYDGNDDIESPEDCKDFNYTDIGGETHFTKALCFNSSDDLEDNDTAWYSTTINYDGTSYDSFIKDYGSTKFTSPMEGDELLSRYFDSLGNRLPFSLFTVLKLEIDETKYSSKWTHNISGRGNIYTLHENRFDFNKRITTDAYILAQMDDGASEYSPHYSDRCYIPLLITTRNAYEDGSVYMSSGGGSAQKRSLPFKDDKCNTIPYTSHTNSEIISRFWTPYIKTMKELITVNPEYSTCELGTFDFNEENCSNLTVATYLMGSVLNLPKGQEVGEHIAILGIKYNLYVDNVIALMGTSDNRFTNSNNRNIAFDDSLIGSNGGKMLIAPINIMLAHEHEEILNYSNFKNIKVFKYLNYTINNRTLLKHNRNYLTTEKINPTKFYHADLDDLGSIRIKELDNSHFETDALGHIKCLIGGSNGKWWESNYKFSSENVTSSRATSTEYILAYCHPIFYNTTMTIYDFIWDVDNNKHHFQFSNDSVFKLVDATFSYLLDDDAGEGEDYIIAVPYRIGPSFTHKW